MVPIPAEFTQVNILEDERETKIDLSFQGGFFFLKERWNSF